MINQHPIDKLAAAFAHIPIPVQLVKIVEEVGEAAGAYIGMLGANPRKGETHTMEDFHTELLDVALTALMLYRNTGGGPPLARLSAHIELRWERHEREVGAGGNERPRDWRGAVITTRQRVMLRETPAGPRGSVVVVGRIGDELREGEVMVRWDGVDHDVWEQASSLEIA